MNGSSVVCHLINMEKEHSGPNERGKKFSEGYYPSVRVICCSRGLMLRVIDIVYLFYQGLYTISWETSNSYFISVQALTVF